MAITYDEVLLRNFRAARAAAELDHARLAARMQALGYKWTRQTVSKIERRVRAIQSAEILGLAYALETSIARLVQPLADDRLVQFPSGAAVSAALAAGSVRGVSDETVAWKGDRPVFAAPSWRAGLDMSQLGNLEQIADEFRAWKATLDGED